MRFRVLIVDEHPIVRLGVCALLDCEDDLLVVGEAGDAETALYLAETLEPYLVVSDLSLYFVPCTVDFPESGSV